MAIERLTPDDFNTVPDDLDTVNEEKIIELGSRELTVGGVTYNVNLRQQSEFYLANVPNMENCSATGKSEGEVLKNIKGRIDMIHLSNSMRIGEEEW